MNEGSGKKSPRHVLIVDDDELLRRSVRRILTSIGIEQIEEAGDGYRALELLRGASHPDVVICDLRMPNMDGITLIRHFADEGYSGHFIIISGEDDRLIASVAELARGHDLSLLGAVEKPVRRSQLEALMLAATERQPTVAETHTKPVTAEELSRLIDQGSIRVVYQPKVDVRSRRVVGVEALSRLEVAPKVIVGPASFLDTATNADLMMELSTAMIAESVHQVSTWQQSDGIELRLAVNITVDSLKNSHMPEFLIERLNNAGITPARITFEVTETQIVANSKLPMEIFNRLHLMGVKLSIDDFGTSYSSFLQLKSLPFKELKIDRSFVSEALRDRAARAIIESSVVLAQRLGIRVVAEGVETPSEWDFIESLGVDEIQGFLVAKPMDAASFTAWMKERAPEGVWQR